MTRDMRVLISPPRWGGMQMTKGDVSFALIQNLMAFLIQRGVVSKEDFLGFIEAVSKGEPSPEGKAIYEFLLAGLKGVPEPGKPH